MRIHSLVRINQIKLLRREGYSIPQLVEKFGIPKTTIWHHVHKIKLSGKALKIIRTRQGGSVIKKQKDIQRAELEVDSLLKGLNSQACSLLAMLYWAEGGKKQFSFTNTNPEMIRFFITILNKCFGVAKERIKITVRYFTGMDHDKCLDHWFRATGISKQRINMYYNDGGRRGKSPFGICRVNVAKGGYLLKIIQSLIGKVDQNLRVPVAQMEERRSPNA